VPLACAAGPAATVAVAWLLSVRAGFVPDCNPLVEGCTSISRAARHGAGNVIFKTVMLPCAVLQAGFWVGAAHWIGSQSAAVGAGRWVPALGVVAAMALAAYAGALGTDGAFYQWMRRFGITFYFGATFLAILSFERALLRLDEHRGFARAILLLCGLMLALGVASTIISATVTETAAKARLENVFEWWLGVLLTAWFLVAAGLWRRVRA
jgi:hypothetical protein